MNEEEQASWLDADPGNYVNERIAAGDDPEVAKRIADTQLAQLFPEGKPAPGQHVFHVVENGAVVGSLWLGEALGGPPELWWVYNIEIDSEFRGRGLGRAAMLLAEDQVRSLGGARLGLNVFGHNHVARHLYEELGYRTLAIRMEKSL